MLSRFNFFAVGAPEAIDGIEDFGTVIMPAGTLPTIPPPRWYREKRNTAPFGGIAPKR